MSKRVKELGENAKLSIRNIRREANSAADAEEKDSKLTEDDVQRTKEEIDRLTKEYEAKVTDLVEKKIKEVMEV
jgi:ribosome recycling factor